MFFIPVYSFVINKKLPWQKSADGGFMKITNVSKILSFETADFYASWGKITSNIYESDIFFDKLLDFFMDIEYNVKWIYTPVKRMDDRLSVLRRNYVPVRYWNFIMSLQNDMIRKMEIW